MRWDRKEERDTYRNKYKQFLLDLCKHALDSNLAECLIIKLIWDLGCITPGFYFYSVGSGRSLLSVTATGTRRSNFIWSLHSGGLALSGANQGESPQCGSNRAPKMHQLLASQVGNMQKKLFVGGLLGGLCSRTHHKKWAVKPGPGRLVVSDDTFQSFWGYFTGISNKDSKEVFIKSAFQVLLFSKVAARALVSQLSLVYLNNNESVITSLR